MNGALGGIVMPSNLILNLLGAIVGLGNAVLHIGSFDCGLVINPSVLELFPI